jgi:hypothetical protein
MHAGQPVPKPYSVAAGGLTNPPKLRSSLKDSPSSGFMNIRLSQVRVWIPGLKPTARAKMGRSVEKVGWSFEEPTRSSIIVEIKQEGKEHSSNSENAVFEFTHSPVFLSFQFDRKTLKSVADIHNDKVVATHSRVRLGCRQRQCEGSSTHWTPYQLGHHR